MPNTPITSYHLTTHNSIFITLIPPDSSNTTTWTLKIGVLLDTKTNNWIIQYITTTGIEHAATIMRKHQHLPQAFFPNIESKIFPYQTWKTTVQSFLTQAETEIFTTITNNITH